MTIHDCALNGASLSWLDERICVLDVREDAPRLRLPAFPLPRGGQFLAPVRESLSVRVTFAIHEQDPIRRWSLLELVRAWASDGGILTLDARPDQQLTVVCTELPALAAEDWTAPLTLQFTTTLCPYWEAAEPTVLTGSSTMSLVLPGTAEDTPVSVTVTNIGASPVTRLTLQCGGTCIIFDDITLPVGSKCYVEVQDGLLSATINGESILPNRTPGSDDLLLAPCGKGCTVAALSIQPLQAIFTARGRYA
ncbi:MAG: hypothetical protein E7318_04170 [Clostridiales bacterium]|nr:hypothetical protein [Clostridiales bacterium]